MSSGATPDDLLLKVSPPRVPRHLLARPRLLASEEAFRGYPVIVLQAPAGFGKTSLLAQWRLEHLRQGVVVAWLCAQQQDDPERLAQGLALAVRQVAGRPTFGHTLLEGMVPAALEGITIWLAELAHTALNVVMIIDEADRLPDASRDALAYLLRNAPPNLRCIVAARPDCRFDIDDLVAYGHAVVVGPAVLRFRLDETLELVRGRFGARVDNDTAARLHALTEGWPLGLQLALAAIAGAADPLTEIAAMAEHTGELHDHFVAVLLANLDAADVDFLIRIAILADLHPELCCAVTGAVDAPERLARLSRDTPLFSSGEQGEWLRIHLLARDVLRQRFAAIPAGQQAQAHAQASAWLADHGLLDSAARHALAAGQLDLAYGLAERSLHESIMKHGRLGAMLEWLNDLPAAELDRRPRLLLAAAWSLALSDRHDEAERLVSRILAQPGVDDALRSECALILGGAAIFADDPDRFAQLHDPWAEAPALHDPMLLQVHANRTAFRTLLDGDPALARLRQQQAPHGGARHARSYAGRWGELVIGLSYVWEGQVLLAENLLQPTLAGVDAELGRRSGFACMLAALLAAVVWERDRPGDAAALLADRLDVLEHHGVPESLLFGYRTMARIAMAGGEDHRAIELLGALDAVGSSRNLPRIRIASLSELVRMHARRFRAQTCRELCEQIDALIEDGTRSRGPLWLRSVTVLQDLARGFAAIAAQDWRGALDPLARADELARRLSQGRLHIEILGLRAFALDRCGEKSLPLLREAADLARSYGLLRVFVDAHPQLGEWVQSVEGGAGDRNSAWPAPASTPVPSPAAATAAAAAAAAAARVRERHGLRHSMVLTVKEQEVLDLLARNLSNKEIGRAMQIGETTIKWHVKNLFAKLDAGTRKDVVHRARILGLLPAHENV